MSARQSAEMTEALRLVKQGMTPRQAAQATGLWYTSIYAALRKLKNGQRNT